MVVSISLLIQTSKAENDYSSDYLADTYPVNSLFMQTGNINSVFRTDGIFNYDKVTFANPTGGFIWPVASSSRQVMVYSSGIWVGAKTILPNNSEELRLSASLYKTHYSPGNIPVIGEIPPQSVCSDSAFSGYLVNLSDPFLMFGGTRVKIAGGRSYTFKYCSWYAWPVNRGAPYVEVNNIPGYQPDRNGDRPGVGFGDIKPDDIIFMVYMDYRKCSGYVHESEISLPGGTPPLGVEVHQLVYSFLAPGLMNAYFTSFKIINKSSRVWDSTFISVVNDAEIGNPNDDGLCCDSIIGAAYFYNSDNDDPEYGIAPPALGVTVLSGPVIYTGNSYDTAKLPCENRIGYKMLGLSGHNSFGNYEDTCQRDPVNAAVAYNFMKSMDGCGNPIINPITKLPTNYKYHRQCCSGSWFDTLPSDRKNMLSTGPFTMNSNDTQMFSLLYLADWGSTNYLSLCAAVDGSARIKKAFMDCFKVIGISTINNSVPKEFSIKQNYPNPFNPSTRIRFELPDNRSVKITVFDAAGREVDVLINSELAAGTYSAEWDASGFPSGVYFYKVTAGMFSEAKKMILLK